MLLPAFGFLLSVSFISVMALLVLGIGKRPRLSIRTFLVFVIAGFIGGVAYAFAYGRLVPAPLDSKGGAIGFLVGGPIFATLAGWFGAAVLAKKRPNQLLRATGQDKSGGGEAVGER